MGNILIVEDQPATSEGLKKIILDIDPTLTVESTGYAAEAFKMAQEKQYNFFLLDIQLIDYDGLTLAQELRKISRYKMTPIVFITAIPTRELIAYKETKCYDYIIKPFRGETVAKTLRDIIDYHINKEREVCESIIIKQKRFSTSVPVHDIVYAEYKQRHLFVYTIDDTIRSAGTSLASFSKNLCHHFIQCHRSYIVNTQFIHSIDRKNKIIKLRKDFGTIPYGEKYKEAMEPWL
jgi:two-component system LytT family response regulator